MNWEIGSIPLEWFTDERRLAGLPKVVICAGYEEMFRYIEKAGKEEYEAVTPLVRHMDIPIPA
jgi:hypothetical protein